MYNLIHCDSNYLPLLSFSYPRKPLIASSLSLSLSLSMIHFKRLRNSVQLPILVLQTGAFKNAHDAVSLVQYFYIVSVRYNNIRRRRRIVIIRIIVIRKRAVATASYTNNIRRRRTIVIIRIIVISSLITILS